MRCRRRHRRGHEFLSVGSQFPVGGTCRNRVWRVMRSSAHRSLTLVPGLPMEARASRSFTGVILKGRPPFRLRAKARPAR